MFSSCSISRTYVMRMFSHWLYNLHPELGILCPSTQACLIAVQLEISVYVAILKTILKVLSSTSELMTHVAIL